MLIPILIFAWFLGGLWSAERFREIQGEVSALFYLSVILFWPAFWFMVAIAAEDETEEGEDDDDQ